MYCLLLVHPLIQQLLGNVGLHPYFFYVKGFLCESTLFFFSIAFHHGIHLILRQPSSASCFLFLFSCIFIFILHLSLNHNLESFSVLICYSCCTMAIWMVLLLLGMIDLIDWRRGGLEEIQVWGGFDEFNSMCVASAIILHSYPLCNDSHQSSLGDLAHPFLGSGSQVYMTPLISESPWNPNALVWKRSGECKNQWSWGSKELPYGSKLEGKLLGIRADLVESNSEPKLIGWSGAADTRKGGERIRNQRCRV